MMPSRRLDDLLPHVATTCRQWLTACDARGIKMLVYCTLRTPEEQAVEYAKGRSVPWRNAQGVLGYGRGHIVTNAPPGRSWHNWGRAWDAVPMVGSQPDWSYIDADNDRIPDEPWWQVAVEEAERLGIEWAGRWTSFKEYVHWQITDGLTIDEAKDGKEVVSPIVTPVQPPSQPPSPPLPLHTDVQAHKELEEILTRMLFILKGL